MRQSKILAKIRAGGIARVCSSSHGLAYLPQLAAHFGYDGIWIDAEHRNWDPREAELMMMRHWLADVDCLWRPTRLDKPGLTRMLEDGATGLMIPQVNTPEMAQQMVAATKFPPLGDRGLDGCGIDSGFWVRKPVDFIQRANVETFLMVQIETPLAVKNVDAIAAVDGVDLLFVGPGDLSLRLGVPASYRDPQLEAALDKTAAACRKHGKHWGCPVGSVEDAEFILDKGAKLLAWGSDFWAMHEMLKETGAKLDALLGPDSKGKARNANKTTLAH